MCAMLRMTMKYEDGEFPMNLAVLTDYQEWRVMLCPAVERRLARGSLWPFEDSDPEYLWHPHPFPVCDEDKWLASRAGTRHVVLFLITLRWESGPKFQVRGGFDVLGYWGMIEPGNTDTIWVSFDRYWEPWPPVEIDKLVNPLTVRTFVPALTRYSRDVYTPGGQILLRSTSVSADMSHVVPPPLNPDGRMGYNWNVHHGMFGRMNQRNTERLVRVPDQRTGAGIRIVEPSVKEIMRQIEGAVTGAKSETKVLEKLSGLRLEVKLSDDTARVFVRHDAWRTRDWRTFVWSGDPLDFMIADCSSIEARTTVRMEKYMSAIRPERTSTPEPGYFTTESFGSVFRPPMWWLGRGSGPEPGDPVGYEPDRLPRLIGPQEVKFEECEKFARAIIEDPSGPVVADATVSLGGKRVFIEYEVEVRSDSGLVGTLYLNLPSSHRGCYIQLRKAEIRIGAKRSDPPNGEVTVSATPAGPIWGGDRFFNPSAYACQAVTWRPDGKWGIVEHFFFQGAMLYSIKYGFLDTDAMFDEKQHPRTEYPIWELKSQYQQDVDSFYNGDEMVVTLVGIYNWRWVATFAYPPDLTPGRVIAEYRDDSGAIVPVRIVKTNYKLYFSVRGWGEIDYWDAYLKAPLGRGRGAGLHIWPEHDSRMYLFNSPALVQTEGRPLKFTWEPFS